MPQFTDDELQTLGQLVDDSIYSIRDILSDSDFLDADDLAQVNHDLWYMENLSKKIRYLTTKGE